MRNQNKKGFRRKEVLIIESSVVPDSIWKKILEISEGDRYLHYISEFSPSGDKDHWGNHLSQENLEKYWEDQRETNNYNGTLAQFIKDYYLEIDKWLIETGYDFTGVKEIFFER